MSKRSEEPVPWNDIEILLDAVRVEEEVVLAVMEVLGELDDSAADEFSWDDFLWANAYDDFSENALSSDHVSLEKLAEEGGFAA